MVVGVEGEFPISTFWQELSHMGKRVAVIDAPKTRLCKEINGIQIVNWATHDPDAFNCFDAIPGSLVQKIKRDYPKDPIGSNDWGGRGPSDYTRYKKSLIQNIRRRKKLSIDLLTNDNWDLFFTVFDDLHQLGHLAWHFHDKNHPRWNPDLAGKMGDPIEHVAIELDQAIGELLSNVGEDTTVIVFNSLGMGPNYNEKTLLARFLSSMDGKQKISKDENLYNALGYLWRQTPLSVQKLLLKFQIFTREILFSGKRADGRFFCLPLNEGNGGIRLNLQGREPDGKIAPTDYESVCTKLVEELKTIHDPETGRPLVKNMIITRAVFTGEKFDLLPDIIIEWDADKLFRKVAWSKGELEFKPHEWRTGSHRSSGFLIAKGKNFEVGESDSGSSLMDMAPTLYTLLGVDGLKTDGQLLAGFRQV